MSEGVGPRDVTADNYRLLLAYVADLELEVDRLRRHGRFLGQAAADTTARILRLCPPGDAPPLSEIGTAARQLTEVLADLHDPPGYHPAHDQVVAIAVRPLAEQVFRWQQRLNAAPGVALRLDLEVDHVEWFPARLRHILDNLFSNALKYRDPSKAESWVRLGVRVAGAEYELRVTDNGVGLTPGGDGQVLDLFYRAAPARAAVPGVGLAVVKLLVEQSGGAVAVTSEEGRGTEFALTLPRFPMSDYLD
jgi:signal transduction histidine kinase